MSDIFDEVNEDVRRDQYIRLWKAYGKYGIAILVAIVVGTASGVGFHEYSQSKKHTVSDRYEAAVELLQSGNEDEALAAFSDMRANLDGSYQVLAVLREAAIMSSAGNREGAVAAYERIVSGDVSAPPLLRDLAALRAAMLLLDSAPRQEVEIRLAPLAQDDSPLRYSARELQGLLALRYGEAETAREILSAITHDGNAPPALRARAAALVAASGGAS